MYQTAKNNFLTFLFTACFCIAAQFSFAQAGDTLKKVSVDTTKKPAPKKYNVRKATIRSAILPGWGQVYNKKYWKVPIVYAGLGISGGVFLYNLQSYKDTRFAYRVRYNMSRGTDSASFVHIKDELKPLSLESLRYYRNQYRRDIDYAVIFFVVMWGLNVVDATVDAHLKGFDVSPDLSLRIKPGYSEMAGTNGLSLVLSIGRRTADQGR